MDLLRALTLVGLSVDFVKRIPGIRSLTAAWQAVVGNARTSGYLLLSPILRNLLKGGTNGQGDFLL